MSNIRVDVGYTIKDGTEIKFRSPVDCAAITGLIVYYPGSNGNITSKVFTLADAHGNNVGNIDHLFAENVVVKVILDVTTSMAFVQNADTNAYLEAQLASKAPKDILMYSFLTTAGWYKVGTVRPLDQYCGSLRITTDGSYFNNEPPCAVIDVIFGYRWASAKTVVASPGGNGGISKVALVKESGSVYGVYIYYNVNNSNQACLKIRAMGAIFTPENFKVVSSFNETSASAVTDVYNASFAPSGYGLGEKCITVSSWDDATKNGFYHCEGWSGYVTAHAAGDISQECFGQMSGKMYKRFRWYCDGSWKEWEWVNPPLQFGVPYRTTERFLGLPVYQYAYYIGYWDQSRTSISLPTDAVVNRAVSIDVYNAATILNDDAGLTHVAFAPTGISITADWPMGDLYFVLKYT